MRRGFSLSVLLGLLTAGLAAAQGSPAPQIAFQGSVVSASGLTAGKAVVWFGVEHAIDAEFAGDIMPHYRTGVAAADGTASLDLGRDVVTRSMWVVVDLDSGAYALAAPEGYRVAPMATPPSLVHKAGVDELLDGGAYVLGMAVRPGSGAWTFAGGDGGPRDVDGASDGSLSFSLDQFDSLSGAQASPAQIAADDLWFVIDPLTMGLSVLKGGVAQ